MGGNTGKSGTKVRVEGHKESYEAETSLPPANYLEVDCIIKSFKSYKDSPEQKEHYRSCTATCQMTHRQQCVHTFFW